MGCKGKLQNFSPFHHKAQKKFPCISQFDRELLKQIPKSILSSNALILNIYFTKMPLSVQALDSLCLSLLKIDTLILKTSFQHAEFSLLGRMMGSPSSLVAQNLLILHPPGNILNQILMLLHNKKLHFYLQSILLYYFYYNFILFLHKLMLILILIHFQ